MKHKTRTRQVGNSPSVSRSLRPLLRTSNAAGGLQSADGVRIPYIMCWIIKSHFIEQGRNSFSISIIAHLKSKINSNFCEIYKNTKRRQTACLSALSPLFPARSGHSSYNLLRRSRNIFPILSYSASSSIETRDSSLFASNSDFSTTSSVSASISLVGSS